ncbi:hypothetical protein P153DRAFT_384239 [Dothidotthia symphoricarpi CBS 119687]|uniref:Xylanolytic transcriptional activator regulatory domain-containing protein n=1 Tax=Dothidotthia symphoricarpi CBS 119687 TaxID=1392245 RepID=A0A6A6AGB3_9PLEO|nr:uncharacterized protein P153DRAFT_384239 [Dothidotthia symphoricarpi CBS 119687]KAF2131022.1 hypothetical protein P153DRAFT_384239 [Dothidotthia symphoricarpi CBS 119687]
MQQDTSPAGPLSKRRQVEATSGQTPYEELYHLLRTRPPATVNEIVRRVRDGVDAQTVVRHVRDGDLITQLSLQPDTRCRFTLPFAVDIRPLFTRTPNIYLNSRLFQSLFEDTASDSQQSLNRHASQSNLYNVPYHAALIVDARLRSPALRPSRWTSVSSDDAFLKKLLEVYFQFEYPFFSFFHKDIFLDDMIAGSEDYCSGLLVNAILATACHGLATVSDRAEFWNPQTWGYRFQAEANRLWELEVDRNRLTTIQAAAVMFISYSQNALDKIGNRYWTQALLMAEKLDLFSELDPSLDPRLRVTQTVTAWALFNLQAKTAFFYFTGPLLSSPPKAELPHHRIAQKFFGEIWLQYPRTQLLVPLLLGPTFVALCEFHSITHDVAKQAVRAREQGTEGTLPMDKAAEFYRRWKQWRQNLPTPLSPAVVVLPVHLMMHMQYHIVVRKTFGVMITHEVKFDGPHASATTLKDYIGFSPAELVAQSQNSLEILLHMFYRLHGSESWYTFMMNSLSHIGFDTLEKLNRITAEGAESETSKEEVKALRGTLVLSAQGLWDQGQNSYLSEVLFYFLLEKMQDEDVALLEQGTVRLADRKQRKALMQTQVLAEYPINVVNFTEDASDRRIEKLVDTMRNDAS